jgi:membrane protease YdiL (CAAX protease family)
MRDKAMVMVPFKAMRDKAMVMVPFILIILAEVSFYFKDASTTLSLHLLNIFLCVLLAIFIERYSDVFQALMLISLLRVLNIGMPIFFNMTLYWMPFVYGSIIISAYILWRMAATIEPDTDGKQPLKEVLSIWANRAWAFINGGGMREKSHWNNLYIPAALLIGLVLANMEFLVLGPNPLIPDLGLSNLAALAIVMIVFVGFGEELVFRGFLQVKMESHWGVYVAMFASGLTFSIMHSGYSSVPYLLFVLFVGMLLAVLFWKTRSLVFVSLIHGALNFFLFSFLPNGWAIKF